MRGKNDEIRIIRKKAGMTQEEMSMFLQIPKRTIQDWEVGKRTPPAYVIDLISFRLLGY